MINRPAAHGNPDSPLQKGAAIFRAERVEPQENANLVPGHAAARWLMEIRLADPEVILASCTQNKPDGINDGGFAGIVLSHQCRDAGRQGQLKRGVPFAKSSEVLDPYFG